MVSVPEETERHLQFRALVALSLASVRYVRTVAPVVARCLDHWRARARAIGDPELRKLALRKLDTERFNAEAGAMLATLAPAEHRAGAVEAIVALELLFDLLDGLTERPLADPLADGQRLFAPFVDALRPGSSPAAPAHRHDDYMGELSDAAHRAILVLPAAVAVRDLALLNAQRAAQAQIRMHAVPTLGIEQLQLWAQSEARAAGGLLGWRELLVGSASSVLSIHALIVAAADGYTTSASAARIGDAYLSVCVLVTLLDGLLDREDDRRHDRPSYLSVYPEQSLPAQALPSLARGAAAQLGALPNGAHHLAMLAGVVAYYTSAPGARDPLIRPATAGLRRQLAPLILPALAVMHVWRLARRVRDRTARIWRPGSER
jgi:hypothetical protein